MQLRKRSNHVNYTENGSPTTVRARRNHSAVNDLVESSDSEDEATREDTVEDTSGVQSSDEERLNTKKRPLGSRKRRHSSTSSFEKEKLSTDSVLVYRKRTGWNSADRNTSQSSLGEDDDGDFVTAKAKRKKRKILSEPRSRSLRARKSEVVNYKDASSSDESTRGSSDLFVGDDEPPESSKPSLRKRVASGEGMRVGAPSVGSADSPGKGAVDDSVKCYARRSKNASTIASDDEGDHLEALASFRKDTSGNHDPASGNSAAKTSSRPNTDVDDASDAADALHSNVSLSNFCPEKPTSRALRFDVDSFGLRIGGGDYGPITKRFDKVERILAVRNRSAGSPVYCIKLQGRSYRRVVNVLEASLLKICPQLLRTFLKRMDILQRMDGHPGDHVRSPAFSPLHLKIDRIVTVEKHKRGKDFLVKWCGLAYSESTWETEFELREDADAIKRYRSFNQRKKTRSQPTSSSKLVFKDGRCLRDYQEEGVSWLENKYQNKINCILADEMGLGKTIQSVAMLETLRLKHAIQGPFLVVAPVSTLGHWQREVESLTHMNCVVYSGTQEDRHMIQTYEFRYDGDGRSSDMKFNVLLTSFEILMKDQNKLSKIRWQFIIVDEAHRLKSRESKTTQSLKQMEVSRGGLLFLTGTPVQNNTKEIFSLLNILDPENFDSEEEFLTKFGDLKNAEQVKDLQDNVLRPRLLRRMKEDVEKSIPQKEETIVWVEMTRDQWIYYRAIYENNIGVLLKGSQGNNIPCLRNVAMELRKVCNHPLLCDGIEEDLISKNFGSNLEPGLARGGNDPLVLQRLLQQSSGKMVLVDKLLPMLKEAGRRVLIFSQFTMMLDLLEDYLIFKGYTYERIDGKIRGSDRQAAIDRYSDKESDIFVFLLSTRAGGLGITLTAADTCLIYDSDWNPQNDLQAMARCHRIGQTKDVKIYRLITRNTYEQKLFECSSRKYGLDEAILGNRVGADDDLEQSMNIESLLKHGAYDMVQDDGEADAAEFSAQNIHQILEQRTQKRLIGGRGVNTFSVATFISHQETESEQGEKAKEQLAKGTEEFWHELMPDACRAAETTVDEAPLSPLGPRKKRAQVRVDYREDPKSVSDDDTYHTGDSGGESQGDDSSVSVESEEDDDRDTWWSEREVKRLEDRLMVLGKNRARQIQQEARLEHHDLYQIEQAVDYLIQLCSSFVASKHYSQVSSASQKSPDANTKEQRCEEIEKPTDIYEGDHGVQDNVPEAGPVILPLNCVLVNDYESGVNYRKEGCLLIGDTRRPIPPVFLRKAMKSRILNDRLGKNASRYLQVLNERDILSSAIARNDPTYLPPRVPIRSKKIPSWWGPQEDLDLIIGVHRHGHREFKKVRMDPTLCFVKRMGVNFQAQHIINAEGAMMNIPYYPNQLLDNGFQGGDWPPDSVLVARLKKLIQLLPNATGPSGTGLRENNKRNRRSDKKRPIETSGIESIVPKDMVAQKTLLKTVVDMGSLPSGRMSTITGKENEIISVKKQLPLSASRKDPSLEISGQQQRITGYFATKVVTTAILASIDQA